MIKRISSLPSFPKATDNDLLHLRLEVLNSVFKRNGFEVYALQDSGKTSAVLGKFGCGVTLLADENTDFLELDAFFSLFGCEVICECQIGAKLKPKAFRNVNLLEYKGDCFTVVDSKEVKLSSLYALLQNGLDGDIVLPCFDDWYTDFCRRYNLGAAEYYCDEHSVAVCAFKNNEAALITGVAVDKAYRGKGLGVAAVNGLIAKLREKNKAMIIYTLADDKTVGFYESLEFKKIKKYSILNY